MSTIIRWIIRLLGIATIVVILGVASLLKLYYQDKVQVLQAAVTPIQNNLRREAIQNFTAHLIQPKSSWMKRNVMNYVSPPPFHLCQDNPTFIVMVLTAPNNFINRQVIRSTWGSVQYYEKHAHLLGATINFGFLLGKSGDVHTQAALEEEHKIFGDIIQADYQESWENMTYKSILALKFAAEFCRNSQFMVKVDDDVFLNTFNLVSRITKLGLTRSMAGQGSYGQPVLREGRYGVKMEDYPNKTFPPYCSGPMFVITMDAVPELFDLAMRTRHFNIDDVFITGFLREKLNIKLANVFGGDEFDNIGFNLTKACGVKTFVLYHGFSPKQQTAIWNYLLVAKFRPTYYCPFNSSYFFHEPQKKLAFLQ